MGVCGGGRGREMEMRGAVDIAVVVVVGFSGV